MYPHYTTQNVKEALTDTPVVFVMEPHQVGLDRPTIKKCLTLLEQLFLVEQLPTWHSNEYKRLIKMTTMHSIECGYDMRHPGLTKE